MQPLFQDSFILGECSTSHFFRVTTSTQKFLFRSSYFFRGATFFEELLFSEKSPLRNNHYFQNNYFLRAKHLPRRYFLRIGSSLGQVLFGTPTFWVEKLFRIQTLLEKVLFRTMYLCATFSDELLFGKSYFFRKARFRFVYFSWIVTFLDWLLFLKDLAVHINYIFRRATFSQNTFSEETLFHSKEIITFHVYHLVIK